MTDVTKEYKYILVLFNILEWMKILIMEVGTKFKIGMFRLT